MGVISQNGIDYPVPSVPVQSDGSATDLTNAAVPTGQTIKSYLNSNFIKEYSNLTATTDSNGNAMIPTSLTAKIILFAWNNQFVFIPFFFSNRWYVRVQLTDAQAQVIVNTSVTFSFYYI